MANKNNKNNLITLSGQSQPLWNQPIPQVEQQSFPMFPQQQPQQPQQPMNPFAMMGQGWSPEDMIKVLNAARQPQTTQAWADTMSPERKAMYERVNAKGAPGSPMNPFSWDAKPGEQGLVAPGMEQKRMDYYLSRMPALPQRVQNLPMPTIPMPALDPQATDILAGEIGLMPAQQRQKLLRSYGM